MSEGVKYDGDKLKWSLLEFQALEGLIRVLMFGESKYPHWDNWKKVEPTTRYWDALLRHLKDYRSGERNAQDSELSHLSHALANLVFLCWFEAKGRFGPDSFSAEDRSGPPPLPKPDPQRIERLIRTIVPDVATISQRERQIQESAGELRKSNSGILGSGVPLRSQGAFEVWLKAQAAQQGIRPLQPSEVANLSGKLDLLEHKELERLWVERMAAQELRKEVKLD